MNDESRESRANYAVIGLLVCATVLSAMSFVASARAGRSSGGALPTNVTVKEWRQYAASGHRLGGATSPVVITEFSDFECPFCAKAQPTLRAIVAKYSGQVAIAFHHWPQTVLHAHALDAAIAAECAADQGHFESYHDALFAHQDSIGVRSWVAFAMDAGLSDTVPFKQCMLSRRHAKEIADDARAGEKLGGRGTPFFLVNEHAIFGAMPLDVFDAAVKEALAAVR